MICLRNLSVKNSNLIAEESKPSVVHAGSRETLTNLQHFYSDFKPVKRFVMESYKKPSKASFLDSDVTRAATTKSTGCFKHIFKAQQTVTTVEEENQRYKAIPSGYRMATDRSFDAIDEHLKDKKKIMPYLKIVL